VAATRIERRALALLLLLAGLLLGTVLFLLYARGVFEPTQRLVLMADDSEGVAVGMDLTFSGFPIGRVARIELAPSGRARILIDVPRRDAHWLRSSSVFTLTRGLVGNTNLRAYSGVLTDPPLPDGAERRVLAGDASTEMTRTISQVRDLVANLTALTAADAALAGTLTNLESLTTQISGPRGALALLLGGEAPAEQVREALARSNRLLARLDGLTQRTEGLVQRADGVLAEAGQQVLGPQGLARDAQAGLKEATALLAETRRSLQQVDRVLLDVQATAQNVRGASTDLDQLRSEVDASLRRVDGLLQSLQQRWPFQRDAELKLP
jgi:phospholipid/cholesterol/gamma-HCH transport system substrate-binding protein